MIDRWPHIKQYLQVDSAGGVEDDFRRWLSIEDTLSPALRATAYEEWADFHEFRLELRANELATDRIKRHLVAGWTDSMTYCCRRGAAFARGEDPGQAVPQRVRRPDLYEEGRAIVAEIIAELEMDSDELRKAG